MAKRRAERKRRFEEPMPWPRSYFCVHPTGRFQQYDGVHFGITKTSAHLEQD